MILAFRLDGQVAVDAGAESSCCGDLVATMAVDRPPGRPWAHAAARPDLVHLWTMSRPSPPGRYGLVVVAWIGALKYTQYEAKAIQPLIANSPFMSWLYDIFSTRALGAALGTAEIIAALLIALYPLRPRISAVGSAFTVLLFLGTLSFLFTTPGVTVPSAGGGFLALSGLPGQFLLKDLVLLGAALWTLGESLGAARLHARPSR